jgi:hypothetical protein
VYNREHTEDIDKKAGARDRGTPAGVVRVVTEDDSSLVVEAKKSQRRFTVRITPRIEKILKEKLKPYMKYGFDLEEVKDVYKRGVTEYVIFPRSGIDRLSFALARVTSFLTGTGTKDLDLMPAGFQARPLTR